MNIIYSSLTVLAVAAFKGSPVQTDSIQKSSKSSAICLVVSVPRRLVR